MFLISSAICLYVYSIKICRVWSVFESFKVVLSYYIDLLYEITFLIIFFIQTNMEFTLSQSILRLREAIFVGFAIIFLISNYVLYPLTKTV